MGNQFFFEPSLFSDANDHLMFQFFGYVHLILRCKPDILLQQFSTSFQHE